MRISDWSSDVCSSDLIALNQRRGAAVAHAAGTDLATRGRDDSARNRMIDAGFRRGGELQHLRLGPARHSGHGGDAQIAGGERAGLVDHRPAHAGPRTELRSEARRGGKRVSVRVDLGGRRILKKKKTNK